MRVPAVAPVTMALLSVPVRWRSTWKVGFLAVALIPFSGAFWVGQRHGAWSPRRRCDAHRSQFQQSRPLLRLHQSQQTQQTYQLQQTQQSHETYPYEHALAILTMPETSLDRIANEAIIETILPETRKLSVVLRCQGGVVPSTAALRRYVGEIYSQLWDVALGADSDSVTPRADLPNAIVYPQNLPNAAPESWLDIQADLDCICSHDATIGWTSACASTSTAQRFALVQGNGVGGLTEHVANVNRERAMRQLPPVRARPVDSVPRWVPETNGATDVTTGNPIVFLEDDNDVSSSSSSSSSTLTVNAESASAAATSAPISWLAGASPIPHVYDSVCVGGTFDGLHFGHRKLLTLAVSSVTPVTGTLLVGVTVDAMLQQKAFCDYIPPLEERCQGVTKFLHALAPGMINRIQVVPIADAFGPPGQASPRNRFNAIVLSHETLHTGYLLNQHRVEQLSLPPLQLLCTRRTEAHGMSSTALRRIRQQRQESQSPSPQGPNVILNL